MNNLLLAELRFKAMELVSSQQSEEYEPFIIHKTYEEFLAELIVQECANIIKSNQWAKDSQPFSKGMIYSSFLIKRHFGVEE
jgi:hypothetical protein